ncbi:MAG: geranylgeranyl reductase family protein [Bacteroidota bacterium]|nr:geranylgeranyl reductase family protein [Bacteroidota bacterium]
MDKSAQVKEYDVIIVGAGPAGSSCALTLQNSGLRVALLDKATFPRDKVCGDAIPGLAIKTLKSISPDFIHSFKGFEDKLKIDKTALNHQKGSIEVNWSGEAYTSTRFSFDNFLFSLVKANTSTDIYLNAMPSTIVVNEGEVVVTDKKTGIIFKSQMIVGSDGAQSVVAKQLANRTIDRNHYIGSVRAYFHNVGGIQKNLTEIYLNKKIFPGYLWIFPLPGNKSNVGLGVLSSAISKNKLNLKKCFYELIAEDPQLVPRFKEATQLGELEGFGLPLGSKRVQVSGNRFILAGDAACLIDPVSGDGIGNAVYSGKVAGQQVIKCFKASNFSDAIMKQYDDELFKLLGPVLSLRFKLQRAVLQMPFVINLFFWLIKSKRIKKRVEKLILKVS